MKTLWRSRYVVILFNRVIIRFTIMALVRQKIRELCEEKSSKPWESKMRKLSLERNHLCSSTQRVHFIFVFSQYLYNSPLRLFTLWLNQFYILNLEYLMRRLNLWKQQPLTQVKKIYLQNGGFPRCERCSPPTCKLGFWSRHLFLLESQCAFSNILSQRFLLKITPFKQLF